jgi:hypothetical protein
MTRERLELTDPQSLSVAWADVGSAVCHDAFDLKRVAK